MRGLAVLAIVGILIGLGCVTNANQPTAAPYADDLIRGAVADK